jgi:hypothetical protein
MSDSDLVQAQRVASVEDVAGSLGRARYTVRAAAWSPLLSDDYAALLAPPVVVRAAVLPTTPRPTAGRHRRA